MMAKERKSEVIIKFKPINLVKLYKQPPKEALTPAVPAAPAVRRVFIGDQDGIVHHDDRDNRP